MTSNRFDIARAQAQAWSILARSFAAKRVASTYLFYGPEGVGAWALALEFAALLNCPQPVKSEQDPELVVPCHECRSCRLIAKLNFEGLFFAVPVPPHKKDDDAIDLTNDVLELKRHEPFALLDSDAPLTIPISVAREIRRRLATQSVPGITRVVMFYQMERMKAQSADALLKLIEEPPPHTVLVLTAVRPEALLPTIQSRARRIRLGRLPEDQVVKYLMDRFEASEDDARMAAGVADRSLGRAIRLIAAEDSRRATGKLLFRALVEDTSAETIEQLIKLVSARDLGGAQDLLRLWQSLIRDCAYYSATGDEDNLVNIDFAADVKRWSTRFVDSGSVARMVEITKNTLAQLGLNVHIHPALVAMVLRLKACLETPVAGVAQERSSG